MARAKIARPPLEKGRGRYAVVVTQEPAPDLRWNAQVREVPAALTHGKTIDLCLRRIREALALFVDDAATAELAPEVHAAGATEKIVRRARAARERAQAEQERAQALMREAARRLARTMTVRDVAALLGVSHQRVQQLVE